MTLESFGNRKLRIKNEYLREFMAEFFGMFVLMVFGLGVNAQSTLSGGAQGSFLAVVWGWGISVAVAVWVCGGVTGGHINPAVSLAMAVIGRLKFKKLLVYWAAQYIGAFAASATIYIIYADALNHFDGGVRMIEGKNATAGIWATYPNNFLSTTSGFSDQVFGTMLLLICVMAITDSKNTGPPKGLVPFCVGLSVFLIGTSFAWNCGYAINPARDLSPRIFTAIAGWGRQVFTVGNYWFWVPLVAPHIGGVLGALIYLMHIGFHIEEESSYDIDQKPVSLKDLRGVQNSEFTTIPELKPNDSVHF